MVDFWKGGSCEATNWSNEKVVIRGIWWGYNGNDEEINDGDKNEIYDIYNQPNVIWAWYGYDMSKSRNMYPKMDDFSSKSWI